MKQPPTLPSAATATVQTQAPAAKAPADSLAAARTVLRNLDELSAEEAAAAARAELQEAAAPTDTTLPSPLRAWEPRVTTALNAPRALASEGGNDALMAWQTGIPPFDRQPVAGYNSGVMLIVITAFLLLAACSRHASRLVANFARTLFRSKHESIFDDYTVSETRFQACLLFILWICEGVIAYTALRPSGVIEGATAADGGSGVFLPVVALIAGAALYYLLQITAYAITGYALGPEPASGGEWVKSFNASQSLLGLALIVPMGAALFAPMYWRTILWVSLILYVIARCVFIARSFAVFYARPASLLNFILYLCALEIAPVVVVIKIFVASA